jgi:hypothetical protein
VAVGNLAAVMGRGRGRTEHSRRSVAGGQVKLIECYIY